MTFKWDYTRWSTFDLCPFKYHQRYIERAPEGPPSEALMKGRRAHTVIEAIIRNPRAEDSYGLHVKAASYVQQVSVFDDKLVEHKLTLDRDWKMSRNVWLTLKMDVVYQTDDGDTLEVVDWKTGRTKAAEYKEQVRLYSVAAASIWSTPMIRATIVNVDDGAVISETMERARVLEDRPRWDARAALMEKEKRFEPRPNKYCDWCGFGRSKGGRCIYG